MLGVLDNGVQDAHGKAGRVSVTQDKLSSLRTGRMISIVIFW